MGDSRLVRSVKGASLGAFWVAGLSTALSWCFKSRFDLVDVLPGVLAGAVVGFAPSFYLPKGFSLPRDITTITHQAIAAFCLWVVADGVVKGEIHGIDTRGFLRAFIETVSWRTDPIVFWTYSLLWGVIGVVSLAVPIFYFSKAIRDTSPGFSSQREDIVPRLYTKWQALPENFRASFIFAVALSSILVFFYLALVLGP